MNKPARPNAVSNLDGSKTHYFDFDPTEENALSIIKTLFEKHWKEIVFGPALQGSIFELHFSEKPKVGYLDGYLTIGPPPKGAWHFHLCVGTHKGTKSKPTPSELSVWRRCSRIAFFVDKNAEERPTSWGLRLWNGKEEQMITVFFPNPWLNANRTGFVKTPDWTKLDLWMKMRKQYCGIPPEDGPTPSYVSRVL